MLHGSTHVMLGKLSMRFDNKNKELSVTKKFLKEVIKELEHEIDYWFDTNKEKDNKIKFLEDQLDNLAFEVILKKDNLPVN